MPYLKLIWIAVIAAVIIIVAVSFSTFYSGIRPERAASDVTPADFNLGYESVKLTTSDNIELDAWHIPAKSKTNKTVIVLHGYPYDKGNILEHSLFLQEQFNLLLFDFRYLGKSGGSYTSVGFHEQKDLEAAVRHLRGRNHAVGAYGFSLGGAVAIMEAKNSNINAVVADSSFATLDNMLAESYRQFGIFKPLFIAATKILSKLMLNINVADVSPEKSIQNLNTPVFLIHGAVDDQIPVANAHQLKKANPNAELWIVEGANHADAREMAGKEYDRRVTGFFEEHIS
ncbi:prolyl oligopeptidase family serine peptidase [Candidatus Woesearchaeota archaeon]|nr:prolyl oligopeptidase family serine peptidase [Candidatus Woesearchaeota archaeon]